MGLLIVLRMATAPKTTIDSLQAGRGLAAVAVVCHHAEEYVRQQVAPLPAFLSHTLPFGFLGVDFFFVLSGFIIYYTNRNRVGREGWRRKYAESRLTRIYVPYLPVGIAMALAYSFLPTISHGESEWTWLSSLTLLPSSAKPALQVAWTLQHEIIFYGLAFVFLFTRRVLAGCLIWMAVIIVLAPFQFNAPAVSLIDLEFIFGIACAWLFMEDRVQRDSLLYGIGALLVLAFFVSGGDRDYSVIFGMGLAFMLLPIVRMEWRGRIRISPALTELGNASYAIYLVHLPFLSIVVRLFKHVNPLIALALGITLSVLVGLIYHWIFEKPALKLVRQGLRRRLPLSAPTEAEAA